MSNIIKPTLLLVCRSAFCVHCKEEGRPNKKDVFMVYGTHSQNFKRKICHREALKGYTPHLYSIKIPYTLTEEGLVVCIRTCLMSGCGVTISEKDDAGNFKFMIDYVETIALPIISVEALITLWRSRTGYELF